MTPSGIVLTSLLLAVVAQTRTENAASVHGSNSKRFPSTPYPPTYFRPTPYPPGYFRSTPYPPAYFPSTPDPRTNHSPKPDPPRTFSTDDFSSYEDEDPTTEVSLKVFLTPIFLGSVEGTEYYTEQTKSYTFQEAQQFCLEHKMQRLEFTSGSAFAVAKTVLDVNARYWTSAISVHKWLSGRGEALAPDLQIPLENQSCLVIYSRILISDPCKGYPGLVYYPLCKRSTLQSKLKYIKETLANKGKNTTVVA